MRIKHEREVRAREVEHEREVRAEQAASTLLARLDGVIDAVGYALSCLECGERDENAIRNAIYLSGELSTEVGRTLLLVRKSAAPAASEAFEELRKAALMLRAHLPDAPEEKASETLEKARVGYEKARELRLILIESLRDY
jgi:hypothetical protein